MQKAIIGFVVTAVGFDLDGTLYPNYRLYSRLVPWLAAYPRFYQAFARARRILHRQEKAVLSFYDEQASLMASMLGGEAAAVKRRAERFIYHAWEELFSGIRLFPQVKETLTAFRRAGFRLAILSDFPPARKIALLGLEGCFDIVLSTEETGALKPSPVPFTALAKALDCEPGLILYVGNSLRYDVEGARQAGMKTALIRRNPLSTGFSFYSQSCLADFVFQNYRQLQEYVLGWAEK